MYPSFSNRFSTTDTPIAVTGLDISKTFVELARKNAANSGVHVQCEHGNASQMPFANQSFDFLVCRAAFKNFANPLGALKEMSRVLKPGARGLIIDLRRDASMADIRAYVDGLELSWFSSLFTKLVFRYMLLPRAWPIDDLARLAKQAPFHHSEVVPNAIGMEVWLEA